MASICFALASAVGPSLLISATACTEGLVKPILHIGVQDPI